MTTPLEPESTSHGDRTSLEQALGTLRPASRLQRDRILFRAGQQSIAPPQPQPGRFASRFWPALAASLALVVLGQGVLLSRRPVKEIEVVYVQASQPATPALVAPEAVAQAPAAVRPQPWLDAPGPTASNRLSWQIIRYGLDGLPSTPVAALAPTEKPLTAGQSLETNVPNLMNPGDPS